MASFYGRDDVVKMLLEKRAEVDVREAAPPPSEGKAPTVTQTPLHVATWYHNEAVVKVLFAVGLDGWGPVCVKIATWQMVCIQLRFRS